MNKFIVQSFSLLLVVGDSISSFACSCHQLNFFSLAHFYIGMLIFFSLICWKISCVLENNASPLCTENNVTWSVLFSSLFIVSFVGQKFFNANKYFHFFLWLYCWIVLTYPQIIKLFSNFFYMFLSFAFTFSYLIYQEWTCVFGIR